MIYLNIDRITQLASSILNFSLYIYSVVYVCTNWDLIFPFVFV